MATATVQVNLRVPAELQAAINTDARRQNVTLSAWALEAFRLYLAASPAARNLPKGKP